MDFHGGISALKFFSKIFVTVTLILCISLSLSGYLLISQSFQNAMEQEKSQTLDQYQLARFTLQSRFFAIYTEDAIREQLSQTNLSETLQISSSDYLLAVFSQEKQSLYCNYPGDYDFSVLENVDSQKMVYTIHPAGNSYFLTITGCFTQRGQTYYLMFGKNIQSVIEQRRQMEQSFAGIYCVVCTISIFVLLLFSLLFARPIKKMTRFASEIAQGNYSSRIPVHTKDELGELAKSCNHMADAIQQSMDSLTQSAIQKDDFVANFAHELKTPLTSIIGYADRIYQKNLSQEEIHQSAWYILDEGMRLEELSRKLMDLIVLQHQEFILEEFSAREVLLNLAETLRPACEAKQIALQVEVDDEPIRVEYDLFKTLLLNLADNAIKSGADTICILGRSMDAGYQIVISDNGCGIPEEEIARITEAFYMVDKSRSRKQHGAGIGLALASRIAQLHGAELKFESTLHHGTSVFVTLFEYSADTEPKHSDNTLLEHLSGTSQEHLPDTSQEHSPDTSPQHSPDTSPEKETST